MLRVDAVRKAFKRRDARASHRDFIELGANIRGLDFRRSPLSRTSFVHAQAGVPALQTAIQMIGLVAISAIAGALAAFAAIFATGLLSPANLSRFGAMPGILVVLLALVVPGICIFRGFATSIGVSVAVLVGLTILSVFDQNSLASTALFYAPLTVVQEFLVLWLASVSVAAVKGISTRLGVPGLGAASLLSAAVTAVLVMQSDAQAYISAADILLCAGLLLAGGAIGWRASRTDSRFLGIARLAIALTAAGGTSFYQADLTEANFSQAALKHVDLRRATLIRTRWQGATGLDLARLDNTYLANPKIRRLVVTCSGQGQNFDGLDLVGVNLRGANLQGASFVGANLNQADLRSADLSRAVLKQTQLDSADLTGATLTGACIEDWGITSTTRLEQVQCEYVYLREPTPDRRNPLRKPDDERSSFGPGEFADFIKPYFDTLDLYHRQDVDPRSISVALKNLVNNHPDAQLQFVAIEWRGRGLNIRYTTAPEVDKSELNHAYFADYAQIRKELLGSIQLRLAAQDAEINRMEGVINTFIQTGSRPSTIQAETIQVIQGEFTMTENRGIHVSAGDNANISGLSSGDGLLNLGTISGSVTHAINQLPDAPASDQPSLKTLLTQLQQAIAAEATLSDPDKADLLEQVQSLAEAQQVEAPKREGIARKAMKMFDATLKSLPDTAKIVDACSQLLPLILRTLGLPT